MEQLSMQTRKAYPSDLTDAEWDLIEGAFPGPPSPSHPGRRRAYPVREVVNAIVYLLKTGCPWRHLPHDLPPYTLVSHYFHAWRKGGLVERLHDLLRARLRRDKKREAQPRTLAIDSQTVRSAEKGGARTPARRSGTTRLRRSRAASGTSA